MLYFCYDTLLSVYFRVHILLNYYLYDSDYQLYINNIKFNTLPIQLLINDGDYIRIDKKYRKFSLLKTDYNDICLYKILKLFNNNKLSINKIFCVNNIVFDENKSNTEVTNEEILRFIQMYYGPDNDLYENTYKIKLKDITDDKGACLHIKSLSYTDNMFKQYSIGSQEYLK